MKVGSLRYCFLSAGIAVKHWRTEGACGQLEGGQGGISLNFLKVWDVWFFNIGPININMDDEAGPIKMKVLSLGHSFKNDKWLSSITKYTSYTR